MLRTTRTEFVARFTPCRLQPCTTRTQTSALEVSKFTTTAKSGRDSLGSANAAWRHDIRPYRVERNEVHTDSSIIPERTRRHHPGRSEPERWSKSLRNLDSVCTSRHGRVSSG